MAFLSISDLTKSYGPNRALKKVNLEVEKGGIHAVLGLSGSGKSTLLQILGGFTTADSGTIKLNKKEVKFRYPKQARKAGVSVAFQYPAVIRQLTVAENIALGQETSFFSISPYNATKIYSLLNVLGQGDMNIEIPVSKTTPDQQRVINIIRALYLDSDLIILDEPDELMTGDSFDRFSNLVNHLQSEGKTILFLTKHYSSAVRFADSCTILRNGKCIYSGDTESLTEREAFEAMRGAPESGYFPEERREPGKLVLKVQHIRGSWLPEDVSFELHRGEILGVAGQQGSGRTAMLKTTFGLNDILGGIITFPGEKDLKVSYYNSCENIKIGMDMMSSDSENDAMALHNSLVFNLTLATLKKHANMGVLNLGGERAKSILHCSELKINFSDINQPVGELSTTDRKKLALARILQQDNDILLLDEPTKGVHSKYYPVMYQQVRKFAMSGKAVVMVSSSYQELLGMCDKIGVMFNGTLGEVRDVSEWSEKSLIDEVIYGPQ